MTTLPTVAEIDAEITWLGVQNVAPSFPKDSARDLVRSLLGEEMPFRRITSQEAIGYLQRVRTVLLAEQQSHR